MSEQEQKRKRSIKWNFTTEQLLACRALYLLFPPSKLPCNNAPSLLVIHTKDEYFRISRISEKQYTIQRVKYQVDSKTGQVLTIISQSAENELFTTDFNGIIHYIIKTISIPYHKIFLSTGLIDSDQFHKYSDLACIYYCDHARCRNGCLLPLSDAENESPGRLEYYNSSESERLTFHNSSNENDSGEIEQEDEEEQNEQQEEENEESDVM